jgi:glycine oxidase
MNEQHNITILGGGIIGLMAAYTLADDHKITIHDPAGFPADNASLMAGGMLAPYSEIEHMDMRWVQAGLKGIGIWKEAPLETGFIQNGSLLIAHPEDRHILERFKSHLPPEKKIPQGVQTIEKQLSQHHQSGLFLNEEAHLDPTKTMTALCDHLSNHKNITLSSQLTSKNSQLTIDCRGMAANDPGIRGVKGEILIVRNPNGF